MTSVYLIGICGAAMATLAAMLKQSGIEVQGSDVDAFPPMDEFLEGQGITPLRGYDAAHITEDIELVVIGNAVSRGNPEVEAVLDRHIRYVSLPDMLRDRFLWTRRPVVVSGTHGKTTTTAMVAWVLAEAGVDPSFFVGGIPTNFDASFRIGQGDVFVIEGDEYDSAFFDKTAKFLKYLPNVAVVGNIEFDHADIYADLEALRIAFRRFISGVPRNGHVLLGADDDEAQRLADVAHCPVETFGLTAYSDWRAVDVRYDRDCTRFNVVHAGATVAYVQLPLLGVFNVKNALAAMAAANAVGTPPEIAAAALGRFQGVRRRLELRGVARGVAVYDDFAHHPTAVRETLLALRTTVPEGRLRAVFEPRSASACRRVFQGDFVEALAVADDVVVAPVHRSTLPAEERLSEATLVADLVAAGTPARHAESLDSISDMIVDTAVAGDVVVLMSNGDFGQLHDVILNRLRASCDQFESNR